MQMNTNETEARKEMLGGCEAIWPLKKAGGKILAFVTWRLNRFGDKPHNNKEYNKQYFITRSENIKEILNFLEDDYSKKVYESCLRYRATHALKYQPDYNKKNQYFPTDIIKLSEEEVFVDCGAYTGDTVRSFEQYSSNHFRKIVAFEPSTFNAKEIRRINNDVVIIPKGVWDDNVSLHFMEAGEGSMFIENSPELNRGGVNTTQCCRIDDCDECFNATFIKMDVEGAELKALKGARNIIEKNHPKLAICIYHTAEDMVEIPLYLREHYPFYKFYIRHHSHRCAETVLYAIP